MIEAHIIKAVVVQDQSAAKRGEVGAVLMGVAAYGDDRVNFKVKYDWEALDIRGFLDDLRDKLAHDFELPVYRVDLKESALLERMRRYYFTIKGQMQQPS